MNKSGPLVALLAFLVLAVSVQAYPLAYRMQSVYEDPDIAINPSVFWNEECVMSISLFATAGSVGSYTLTNQWYSPDAIQQYYGIVTLDSNITCTNMGTANGSFGSTDGFYETGVVTTYSADVFENWIYTVYDCEFDENELFIYNNTAGTDSFGNHPFAYIERTVTQCDDAGSCAGNALTDDIDGVINTLETNYYTESVCDAELNVDRASFSPFTCSDFPDHYWGRNDWTMTPLNSMPSGLVNISVTGRKHSHGADCANIVNTYQVYLWDTYTNSTINLGTSVPFSTEQTLSPSREYWLLIGSKTCGSKADINTCSISYVNSTYNISIWAYDPSFVCGEWSICENGIQTRSCVDPLGKVSNIIETRYCIDVPFFENLLGFEIFTDRLVSTCQRNWQFVDCVPFIGNITAKYPVNWSVPTANIDSSGVIRENFLTISSDTATEGTQSLKMWYIPPKPFEPVDDGAGGTECGNKTIGAFPETSTGFNETLFVAANVSFPSPYIDIRYDVRRCAASVVQYDYTGESFLIWGNPCGKLCYAPNCSVAPFGRYGIRLSDADTGEINFDFFGDATSDWRSFIADLSNVGLETNHNYTLSIAVNPENQFDSNPHCIYVDNVRATLRESEIAECETACDGLDLLLATQAGDSCVFRRITNSPQCAPDEETATAFEEFSQVCVGTTLHTFNNETGKWETIENAQLCIEEAADISAEVNITTPITDIQTGVDTFSFILSPLFLYFLLSLAVSGGLAYAVSSRGGSGTFEIFGVSMLIMVLIGSLPGIALIPIWISFSIVIVIALMISIKMKGFISNGG